MWQPGTNAVCWKMNVHFQEKLVGVWRLGWLVSRLVPADLVSNFVVYYQQYLFIDVHESRNLSPRKLHGAAWCQLGYKSVSSETLSNWGYQCDPWFFYLCSLVSNAVSSSFQEESGLYGLDSSRYTHLSGSVRITSCF